MQKNHEGFTFLELAIALIILSLLVSAATVGKEMVSQAKIKNSIEQLNELQNSIRAFRLTYGELPGDIASATNYWAETENGNGDGRLQEVEGKSLWHSHLQLAELAPGFNKDNENRPMSSLTAWGIEFIYDDQWGNYKTRNILKLYDYDNSGYVEIEAEKLHAIDKKLDDTRPYTGKILATSENNLCDENGNAGSIKCCANYMSMTNSNFDNTSPSIKKSEYIFGSEICSYLFMELNI